MTREEFGTVIFFLEGAFRTSLSEKERDSYFAVLGTHTARSVMKQAFHHASRTDIDFLKFPLPRDLKPSPAGQSEATRPGQELTRYVRCIACGASCPVTYRAVEDKSTAGMRIEDHVDVFSGHHCPPKPLSEYDTDALRRIRKAAAGGWQGRALGRLSGAIVADVDAELARRGEAPIVSGVLIADEARMKRLQEQKTDLRGKGEL